jgi:hypothetical protein
MLLAQKDNNPLSLLQPYGKAGGWRGLVGQEPNGYLIFDTLHNGVRAGYYNLILKLNSGINTIEKIFANYGDPGHEETYRSYVSKETGVSRNKEIVNPNDLYQIGKAIIKMEGDRTVWVPEQTLLAGFNDAMNSIKMSKIAYYSIGGVLAILIIGILILSYINQ